MVILSVDSAVPEHVVEEVRKGTSATFIKALHMPTAKCARGCGCGL